MRVEYYIFLAAITITSHVHAEADYASQFKNNYFLSCSKEMSSGVDAVPLDLALSICSCAASSIVRAYSTEQLKSIDRDVAANHKRLLPHTEKCTNIELPKYMETHPEFLQQYIQQHPELLR
jgi:hypothetical protein